jgi:hypothetical protein
MPIPSQNDFLNLLSDGQALNRGQIFYMREIDAVPDVSLWQTWLNPPPAVPSVAHAL